MKEPAASRAAPEAARRLEFDVPLLPAGQRHTGEEGKCCLFVAGSRVTQPA